MDFDFLKVLTLDKPGHPDTGASHWRASVVDDGLDPHVVYYYALFERVAGGDAYRTEPTWRAAATTTGHFGLDARLYQLLPSFLKRYDGPVSGGQGRPGQLRRLLEVFGLTLDHVRGQAEVLRGRHDVLHVHADRLPHLAGWIGWNLNRTLDERAQRNEILFAPELYRTVGTIPNIRALINRITGWDSRCKEFVHNVCVSNRPERLNLWTCRRGGDGQWSQPTEPLSLDSSYEGRPTAVHDENGVLWLFYHTLRKNRWDVWYKTRTEFDIATGLQNDLEIGIVSQELQQAFAENGFSLALTATIEQQDGSWRITDAQHGESYVVQQQDDRLIVSRWAPSQPLTDGPRLDRHPTSVARGNTLWVFWDSFDQDTGPPSWRIDFRLRHADGGWSTIGSLVDPDDPTPPDRRSPGAVLDDNGNLWLFWLEKAGPRWQIRFNHHQGPDWDAVSPPEFLADAGTFTADQNGTISEYDDLFIFSSSSPEPRLYVFWARRVKISSERSGGNPERRRWQIAYSYARPQSPAFWSDIQTVPMYPSDDDCREPAAIWNEAEGSIELFCSSNRDGSWSIWHAPLDDWRWETAGQVQRGPYSERGPLPVALGAETLLIYGSNESLTARNQATGDPQSIDTRFGGCTTVDTRNLSKIALQRHYEDFQTYTYDTGRDDQDWYARDTVGLFLVPDPEDTTTIPYTKSQLEEFLPPFLPQFLPIQVRAVFVVDDSDTPPGWIWIHSWNQEYPDHRTVDFRASPIDARFRTWRGGLQEEGD